MDQQHERHPLMGEARRKKALGYDPTIFPRRLVSAWTHQQNVDGAPGGVAVETIENVLDAMRNHASPDKVFESAIKNIPEAERIDFGADLFDAAGTLYGTIQSPDGHPVIGRLQVFTLVIHGTEGDLAKFQQADVFTTTARLIRGSGLAADQSNILISSVPLSISDALDISPLDLRHLAHAFYPACMGDLEATEAVNAKVLLLCVQPHHNTSSSEACPNTVTMITRCFVGARMLPILSGDEYDALDGPVSLSMGFGMDEDLDLGKMFDVDDALDAEEDPDSEVDLEEDLNLVTGSGFPVPRDQDDAEASILGARLKFWMAAMSVFQRHNLALTIEGPQPWNEGLAAMGLCHVRGSLMMEAAMLGVDMEVAQKAHVAHDADNFYLALTVGGHVLGPVSIPSGIVSARGDEGTVLDWIPQIAKEILTYESPADMRLYILPKHH